MYRLVRSDAANGFNSCGKCKKKRKNWVDHTFKKNCLIGYYKLSSNWVIFTDYNVYAKVWAMNGYITNMYHLHEKLWAELKPLCRTCISKVLENYKEPEVGENEAG